MAIDTDQMNASQKRTALILINIIGICAIAIWAKSILMPLVFAMLFSFVSLPLTQFLEIKWKMHRALASAIPVIALLGILSGIVYLGATQLSAGAEHLPEVREKLSALSSQFENWISRSLHMTPEKQRAYLDHAVSNVSAAGTAAVGLTIYTLSSTLLFIILTAFFNFFMLMYRGRIADFLLFLFSKKDNITFKDIVWGIQHMIKGYVTGILLEMAIVSTLCTIAFSILGIPYPFLLGLMTGLLNIIPYVGIFSSMAISMVVTLVMTGAVQRALLVGAVIIPVHLIDSNIILPFLVGSRVRVNAFITFLAIVTGGLLWGIAGIFLSIPLAAVAKIIFDHVEGLDHWGFLFGDDARPPGKLFRRQTKK